MRSIRQVGRGIRERQRVWFNHQRIKGPQEIKVQAGCIHGINKAHENYPFHEFFAICDPRSTPL